MDWLLRVILASIVRRGNLRVMTARGASFTVGDGTGEPVVVRFLNPQAQRALLLNPELALGEIYMDGALVVETGTIADLLAIVMDRSSWRPVGWMRPLAFLRYVRRHLNQWNRRVRAQRNVAHHYDLDGRLYSLFLDSDRQYSCAYFESDTASLDDAQLAKKRHLAAKLRLDRGLRVLDIGSGWGGLALYLAEMYGARVTGVTLSQEQLAIARSRAEEKDLSGSVDFHLRDYRDVAETFDRIVSVGMFEHVGVGNYATYFRKCYNLLASDGVMLLHSISRSEGPGSTNPWIAKYIFPGGYIPALSEVFRAIERAGLLVCDTEILHLHYAETLKAWRERFMARRAEAVQLYDERFARMWEFYLAASEMAFRKQNMMNFQIQLAKHQQVVPLTRDYVIHEEARLRKLERGSRPRLRIAGQ